MTNILEQIINLYGINEPFFTKEIKEDLNLSRPIYEREIKSLVESGLIVRAEPGIYFVPNPNAVLKNPMVSVDKIIRKKFIENKDGIIGYRTGINFANSLGLTTQTASIPTIVTNNTGARKRTYRVYTKEATIIKSKTEVNKRNYKLLQVLDLLDEYERLSEYTLENAKYRILEYLNDLNYSKAEVLICLKYYKGTARINAEQIGLI